jgi:uncharacterized protein (TIGR02466 family)
MLKSVFATPIYVVSGTQCLGEASDAFSSFSIEQYYQPEMYGVAGFTTYFDAAANEVVKGLIPNVIKFAEQHSRDYLEMIGYDVSTYDLNVCNMWLSRMRENSNHNFHTHTKLGEKLVAVSGSYYVNIPSHSASLTFSRSEGEFFNQLRLPAKEQNEFTRKFYSHEPKAGDLVLFLAETFHGVLTNKSSENRDVISFNVSVTRKSDAA